MKPKLKLVALKKVSVRMTASSRPKITAPVNAVLHGILNKSGRGSTPLKATTSVNSSTPVKAYTAAQANSPAKANRPIAFGKPAKETGVARAGMKGNASTGAKGTAPVKVSNSLESTTVEKPKSKGYPNLTMKTALPVVQDQVGDASARVDEDTLKEKHEVVE